MDNAGPRYQNAPVSGGGNAMDGTSNQAPGATLPTAAAGSDEPGDKTNFMYREHASNLWIGILVSGAVVVVALILWGIYRYRDAGRQLTFTAPAPSPGWHFVRSSSRSVEAVLHD